MPQWMRDRNAAQKAARDAKKQGGGLSATPVEDSTDSETEAIVVAKAASLRSSTSSSVVTDHEWNTDTGATASMTPNRHWLRNMTPCHVPVRVATGKVVYASGRGEVVFQPLVDGVHAPQIVFTRVLYVPELANNLFAVIPLVQKHGVSVTIDSERMAFSQRGEVILTASYRGKC